MAQGSGGGNMSTMKRKFCSIIALGGLLLAGCAAGPDYRRPPVPVPTSYKELPGWTEATPEDAALKGNWWTDFHDPLLDELEPMVAVSNQTVRQNYFSYEQALAEVSVARSQLFPTVGLTGSVSKSGGGSGAAATASTTSGHSSGGSTSGSLEGTASWSIDLWGKVRRLVEENAATAQADEATLANATLSEQTLLAITLIELRLADADIDLQQKTVDALRSALEIVEHQADAGA